MKPKPYEAQNTKFSEYELGLLISHATFELSKFENRTEVIIQISGFLRHLRPGINAGVFGLLYNQLSVAKQHNNSRLLLDNSSEISKKKLQQKSHIFQNAQVTSNKMVHKKRHHILEQFSLPFHNV